MACGGFAVVTLLTSSDFLPGAQCLFHSLKKHLSEEVDICCLVPTTLEEDADFFEKLGQIGFDVIYVAEPIPNPHSSHVKSWMTCGFTKLRIWQLIDYEKILYIDVDAIIIDDVSELFERDVDFAACPDMIPPDKLNAGVLLIRPNLDEFKKILQSIPYLSSHDGGDTGFLNSFYPNWFTSSAECRLPVKYNAQRSFYNFTKSKPEYWESIEAKIIHYSSSGKPWEKKFDKGLELIWNDYFHEYKEMTYEFHTAEIKHLPTITWEIPTFSGDFGTFGDSIPTNIKIPNQLFYDQCSASFDQHLGEASEIPKLIHIIWLGNNEIPEPCQNCIDSFKKQDDWELKIWKDDDVSELEMNSEALSLFNESSNFGEKSDILRLWILIKFGGLYVDVDFELLGNLNNLFSKIGGNVFIGVSNTTSFELNNAFLASVANHPLLINLLENIKTKSSGLKTLLRTGPLYLTSKMESLLINFTDVTIIPTNILYPIPNSMRNLNWPEAKAYYEQNSICVHHWFCSWQNKQKEFHKEKNHFMEILQKHTSNTECVDLLADLLAMKSLNQ